jgi:cysteine synthase B
MTLVLERSITTALSEKIAQISGQIGNTPLLPITHLHSNKRVKIYAKAEWQQLSGSVKARAAFKIFKNAAESGEFANGRSLLDATSGNTGIAYATLGSLLNVPVTLCMPENASPERKAILESLGAEIIYTSKFGGTDEAQEVAAFLAAQYPQKYFYADQYTNDLNWKAHYLTTAVEIYRDQPGITHFVSGLGTTGTFTGTGTRLKEFNSNIQLIALQPDFALHGLEGWKHLETARIPAIYNADLPDEIREISTQRSYDIIKDAARLEGLLLSPSSAANLAGAIQLAEQIEEGIIVTVLPDNADKYRDVIKQIL